MTKRDRPELSVRRAAFYRICLMLGSLVFLGLVLEIALQVIVPLVFRPRFSKIDPDLGWHHNSSVSYMEETEGHKYRLSYDADGYRPARHREEKQPDVPRLLIIGDSFVDAAEVGDQETFAWLLGECLPNVEVINLGVYGYSTAQELLLLERDGLRYHPDRVIVLTISNDFPGNTMALESFGPAPRFLLDGPGLKFEGTRHPAAQEAFLATNIPAPRWIHRHSLLYYLVNFYVYQPLNAKRIEEVRRARTAVHSEEERKELYRRLIRRMRDTTKNAGAQFLVTYGYLERELVAEESPNTSVRGLLAEDHVDSVDLFAGLRRAQQAEESAGSSLYYQHDIHWNARGNEVAADLLSKVILDWMQGKPLPDQATEQWNCGRASGSKRAVPPR